MPTPELPEAVWDAAHEARRKARYVDDPLNQEALYGLSPYTLRAMLTVAYQAGRESALDRDEWRSVFPAGDGLRTYSSGDARWRELLWLRQCRELHGEDCHLQHRRVGATDWTRVEVSDVNA